MSAHIISNAICLQMSFFTLHADRNWCFEYWDRESSGRINRAVSPLFMFLNFWLQKTDSNFLHFSGAEEKGLTFGFVDLKYYTHKKFSKFFLFVLWHIIYSATYYFWCWFCSWAYECVWRLRTQKWFLGFLTDKTANANKCTCWKRRWLQSTQKPRHTLSHKHTSHFY